jgi:hypothetical protein
MPLASARSALLDAGATGATKPVAGARSATAARRRALVL